MFEVVNKKPSTSPSAIFRTLWAHDSSFLWLIAYFVCNLVLTIYNKVVLAGDFPYPYTLTAIHCLFGTAGSLVCLKRGLFKPERLTQMETGIVVLFSGLYTINIIISNLSLHLVTVPFHQIVRSTTPLFVIALSIAIFQKSYSSETYYSLIPIVLGVALATIGDYYFTLPGLLLTLLGTVLAATKTLLTNHIQKSMLSKPLHPLDLLLRMSPLACVQSLLYAHVRGELDSLTRLLSTFSWREGRVLGTKLVGNGGLAFMLNMVSFTTNKRVGALAMTVAGNVKQCLSVAAGVWVFRFEVGVLNAVGIVVALMGGAWYTWIEIGEKVKERKREEYGSLKANENDYV